MEVFSGFRCDNCDNIFNSKFSLLEHRNVHSGETPFMCISCRKSFSLIEQYVNHIRNLHNAERFLENSEKTCNQKENSCVAGLGKFTEDCSSLPLEVTKSLRDNGYFYRCTKCLINFGNYINFFHHLNKCTSKKLKSSQNLTIVINKTQNCNCCSCKINSGKIKLNQAQESNLVNFFCQNCNQQFVTHKKFMKHYCLQPSEQKNIQCSCLNVFTTLSDFKIHIGKKPYTCCRCKMQFSTVTNLIRHVRTHTKQKPYICKDCGRGFSQSAHLRNHLSLHLGIKAVKCDQCSFSCKTFNGLLKHKKKHKEGFLNDNNYIDGRKKSTTKSMCPICNKLFLFKRNMAMHMKIHSNDTSLCTECGKVFDSKGKLTSHYKACHREPSFCKTCGKIFASAVLLSAHEKIHVVNKLFPCEICQKSFSIKNYLAQHMKTHSNKKQFSCSKCGKLFKVAVSLKYHNNICTSHNIPV